ncbi:CCA tRNA nucleotidyltransferase [Methanocaldococcus infernus]
MKFLKKILEEVKPSEEEVRELKEVANKVIDKIKEFSDNSVLEVLHLGSSARNTNLKNDFDIDIFILFDKSLSIEELERKGLELGKKALESLGGSYVISYASHPYVKGKLGKYNIDIVPCYKIEFGEKIISAVDRTPLHHKFLVERLNEKLCDEVRLLKAFLKSLNIYGSDVKTKGFSGYLCELLILKYGSFLNLLQDTQNWRLRKVIILDDIYKIYENPKFKEFDDPLIVYDPTDLNRNVASPLSKENFCKFVYYSWLFLSEPKEEFFYNYHKRLEEELNEREHGFIVKLEFPKEEVDDIVYPQLEKLEKSINKHIIKNDFVPIRSKCYTTDNYCYIEWEFLVYELPNVKVIEGPPIFAKERVKSFIRKHKKTFVKDCKLCCYEERKYKNVLELFKDILNKKVPIAKTKHISLEKGKLIWSQVQ